MSGPPIPAAEPASQVLARDAHRPWPLPTGRWLMRQVWTEVLFLHWPLSPASLAAVVPPGLELDTCEGSAWLGVIPFRMLVRWRGLPELPLVSRLAELNVRTYVRHRGKPGVLFLSLDATSALLVAAARASYHLPYHLAGATVAIDGDAVGYGFRRRGRSGARFRATVRIAGGAADGPLERWLTERYCLYTRGRRGELRIGEIHHAPWPLQLASAVVEENTMAAASGLSLPDSPPLCTYSPGVTAMIWPLSAAGD